MPTGEGIDISFIFTTEGKEGKGSEIKESFRNQSLDKTREIENAAIKFRNEVYAILRS